MVCEPWGPMYFPTAELRHWNDLSLAWIRLLFFAPTRIVTKWTLPLIHPFCEVSRENYIKKSEKNQINPCFP